MLITIGEAVAYVVSGMYGDVRELGVGIAVLIILQVRLRLTPETMSGPLSGRLGSWAYIAAAETASHLSRITVRSMLYTHLDQQVHLP